MRIQDQHKWDDSGAAGESARIHEVLTREIRRAHDNQEFVLDYQPIYEARPPARAMGFEALARWKHPELGLISPLDFIPIVENTGMVGALTLLVLRESVSRIRTWRGLWPDSYLALNVSPMQLREEGFAASILRTLEETNLPPDALVLEVTETGVPLDDRTGRVMRDLVAEGIRFAADDFGTGHSSLLYLQKYPFQILKLDRNFISDIPGASRDALIVASILELAARLGLTTVAEGVETSEQLQFLQEHGCDAIQGFFLSHPLAPTTITAFTEETTWTGRRRTA